MQDVNQRVVNYTYDHMSNLIYKQINQKYASYQYDQENHLIYEKDEYGYETSYVYDKFGNQIKEVKPDGTQINRVYDKLNRKISENDHSFTYDAQDNLLTAKNKWGTTTYTYNKFNQMTSSTDTNNKTVNYVYNHQLQLIQKNYEGINIDYEYNEYALLQKVKENNQEIASYMYNAIDATNLPIMYNGSGNGFKIDLFGWITSILECPKKTAPSIKVDGIGDYTTNSTLPYGGVPTSSEIRSEYTKVYETNEMNAGGEVLFVNTKNYLAEGNTNNLKNGIMAFLDNLGEGASVFPAGSEVISVITGGVNLALGELTPDESNANYKVDTSVKKKLKRVDLLLENGIKYTALVAMKLIITADIYIRQEEMDEINYLKTDINKYLGTGYTNKNYESNIELSYEAIKNKNPSYSLPPYVNSQFLNIDKYNWNNPMKYEIKH